jgi:hypothetical protein
MMKSKKIRLWKKRKEADHLNIYMEKPSSDKRVGYHTVHNLNPNRRYIQERSTSKAESEPTQAAIAVRDVLKRDGTSWSVRAVPLLLQFPFGDRDWGVR